MSKPRYQVQGPTLQWTCPRRCHKHAAAQPAPRVASVDSYSQRVATAPRPALGSEPVKTTCVYTRGRVCMGSHQGPIQALPTTNRAALWESRLRVDSERTPRSPSDRRPSLAHGTSTQLKVSRSSARAASFARPMVTVRDVVPAVARRRQAQERLKQATKRLRQHKRGANSRDYSWLRDAAKATATATASGYAPTPDGCDLGTARVYAASPHFSFGATSRFDPHQVQHRMHKCLRRVAAVSAHTEGALNTAVHGSSPRLRDGCPRGSRAPVRCAIRLGCGAAALVLENGPREGRPRAQHCPRT